MALGTARLLAKPITITLSTPMVFHSEEACEALRAANAQEWLRAAIETHAKLELLFGHYDIPRTGDDARDFRMLSFCCLAGERFRGFRIVDVNAQKPYRHGRNPITLMMLLADVELLKLERRRSDSAAVHTLTTADRFAESWSRYRGRERTLRNQLAEARGLFKSMGPVPPPETVSAIIALFGSEGAVSRIMKPPTP
jgi:hypothetical protein